MVRLMARYGLFAAIAQFNILKRLIQTDIYIISMRMGNTRSKWTVYSIKKPTRRKQHFLRMHEIYIFLCVILHLSMEVLT